MKFIILHLTRNGTSMMVPVDRIRRVNQTWTGSQVWLGNGMEQDVWFVRETVEEIAELIRRSK